VLDSVLSGPPAPDPFAVKVIVTVTDAPCTTTVPEDGLAVYPLGA
jgi:hypothetical protein